jgi:ankyrin repeat protein
LRALQQSPLMIAVERDNWGIVQMLVKEGAKINSKNKVRCCSHSRACWQRCPFSLQDGLTALSVAVRNR